MNTYRTFLRSANNWSEFASAEKIQQETGLTFQEAMETCKDFNNNRSEIEIEAGTTMEFEEE